MGWRSAVCIVVLGAACSDSAATKFDSKDERVRIETVRSLTASTRGDDVRLLVKALRTDESIAVRGDAATALGHLFGRTTYLGKPKEAQMPIESYPNALTALGEQLTADGSPHVREQCASALRVIGSASSLKYLEASIRDDESMLVRHGSLRAVANAPQSAAIDTLMRLLRSLATVDGKLSVPTLMGITEALAKLGDVVVPELLPLLEAEDWRLRLQAVQALRRMEGNPARSALEKLAKSDARQEVRFAAGQAVKGALRKAP